MYNLHLHHQAGREKAAQLEKESSWLQRIFDPSRPIGVFAMGIATGAVAATAIVAATFAGFCSFWAWFRYIPTWMPGRWQLAELHAANMAARRRERDSQH